MADCCSYLFWYWLGVHLKNKQDIIISILKDCGAKVRPTGSSKVPTNSKTGGSRFDVESKQNEKPNYHLKITKWTSVYQRSATRWWTRSARRWWRQSARWAIGDLIHCVRWPLCTVAQQNEMPANNLRMLFPRWSPQRFARPTTSPLSQHMELLRRIVAQWVAPGTTFDLE